MPTHDYKKPLGDLLQAAESGEITVPFFQRRFVWKKDQLQRLLASALLRIPLGSFLFLKSDRDYFKNRLLATVLRSTKSKKTMHCSFLLDGQQRLTSLHAMVGHYDNTSKALPLQLRSCWFLQLGLLGVENLSMPDLNDIEIEELADSIMVYPADKLKPSNPYHPKQRATERELQQCVKNEEIPLYSILQNYSREAGSMDKGRHAVILREIARSRERALKNELAESKQRKFLSVSKSDSLDTAWEDRRQSWVTSILELLANAMRSEIPAIEVDKDSFHRAISIFEIVNKQGTPLHLFDLLLARAAREKKGKTLLEVLDETLSEEIKLPSALLSHSRMDSLTWSVTCMGYDIGEPAQSIKGMYVNVLGLLSDSLAQQRPFATDAIRRKAVLAISPHSLNKTKTIAAERLARALAFAHVRCGLHRLDAIPYEWMIIAMACALDDAVWKNKKALNKLEYWYWSSLFGGAFRDKQDKQGVTHANLLVEWLSSKKSEIPEQFQKLADTVFNCVDYSDLLTLKTCRNGGLYAGVLGYVLSGAPLDLSDIESYVLRLGESNELEDHHIRPLGGAASLNESAKKLRKDKTNILNSVLNRTLITRQANRDLGSLSPARYKEDIKWERFVSHCIPEDFLDESSNAETCVERRYTTIRDTLIAELTKLRA